MKQQIILLYAGQYQIVEEKICDLDFISEIVMQPVTLPAASDKKAG